MMSPQPAMRPEEASRRTPAANRERHERLIFVVVAGAAAERTETAGVGTAIFAFDLPTYLVMPGDNAHVVT